MSVTAHVGIPPPRMESNAVDPVDSLSALRFIDTKFFSWPDLFNFFPRLADKFKSSSISLFDNTRNMKICLRQYHLTLQSLLLVVSHPEQNAKEEKSIEEAKRVTYLTCCDILAV